MTSPKRVKPVYPHKIPELSDEVITRSKDGVYKIDIPTQKPSKLFLEKGENCDTIQLRCNSLYLRNGNKVHCCNSTVTTIIGNGSGDQTEIVECAKCRTSYLIRKQYKDGKLNLRMAIWDTSRNLKNVSYLDHNDNGDYLIKFNT